MKPLIYSSSFLLRERTVCFGKVKFPSENIAWLVWDRFQELGRFTPNSSTYILNAYKCPYCGYIHLGKNNKSFWNKRKSTHPHS